MVKAAAGNKEENPKAKGNGTRNSGPAKVGKTKAAKANGVPRAGSLPKAPVGGNGELQLSCNRPCLEAGSRAKR